jgi:hypothetical protein
MFSDVILLCFVVSFCFLSASVVVSFIYLKLDGAVV